jgi:hypothetical protein
MGLQEQNKLFKSTANSYGAIGKDARHVLSKYATPPKPMSLAEAKRLIEVIIIEWIRSKQ